MQRGENGEVDSVEHVADGLMTCYVIAPYIDRSATGEEKLRPSLSMFTRLKTCGFL